MMHCGNVKFKQKQREVQAEPDGTEGTTSGNGTEVCLSPCVHVWTGPQDINLVFLSRAALGKPYKLNLGCPKLFEHALGKSIHLVKESFSADSLENKSIIS